ncbi:sortase domain-containing protein [Arthrobacter castelli]|uniref:sortase domain-containing protein n=1 Tax=Arthrobacter castelli TaxID=271431 RepID=UPI000419155B|nr:sortase [Arthrobacter castelli]
MIEPKSDRRLRFQAEATVLLCLLAGCGPTGQSNGAPDDGPGPASTATAPANQALEAPSESAGDPRATAMDASRPVSLTIEALERTSKIIETGLRDDRSLEVPPEHEGAPASWFTGSPTPGQRGPAVLLGHVNSTADDSGVFYNLDALNQGDQISITRTDGTRAIFEVYKSELYSKKDSPTKAVYQPTDGAELRLITCDGFTASSGDFVKNLVIYAKLVDTA